MLETDTHDDLQGAYPDLGELPSRLLDRVREAGIPVEARAGAVLFDEGSPCDNFVLLTRGMVRVVKVSWQGREILLYNLRPGGICALTLSCLIGNRPYPARGVAVEDVCGIALPRPEFDRLAAESVPFRRLVFASVAARLIDLTDLVEEVAFRRLDQRLAAHLLRRSRNEGTRSLALTHQELADELGSVREIVSRLLRAFEARGAVRLERRQVTLLQPETLKGIARETRTC